MISYLIASYRPDGVKGTIASIEALPTHNHEIIVVTPHPEPNHGNVRYILDQRVGGSTYAFNQGVSECNGDWIVVGIDDHVINYDVYKFIDIIHSPAIESLEYQVINLGSPWTDHLARNVAGYGINLPDVPESVMHTRWPVITFPAVSKKTIIEKFDGYLFNPYMEHHFVDHWMGLYVGVRQPNYDFNQMGPHAAWTQHLPGDNCDRTRDATDSIVFCKTAARFIQNPDKYGYATPL
jgi:hypothetical protein